MPTGSWISYWRSLTIHNPRDLWTKPLVICSDPSQEANVVQEETNVMLREGIEDFHNVRRNAKKESSIWKAEEAGYLNNPPKDAHEMRWFPFFSNFARSVYDPFDSWQTMDPKQSTESASMHHVQINCPNISQTVKNEGTEVNAHYSMKKGLQPFSMSPSWRLEDLHLWPIWQSTWIPNNLL